MLFSMFLEPEDIWDQVLVLWNSLLPFTMFSILPKTKSCGMLVIRFDFLSSAAFLFLSDTRSIKQFCMDFSVLSTQDTYR